MIIFADNNTQEGGRIFTEQMHGLIGKQIKSDLGHFILPCTKPFQDFIHSNSFQCKGDKALGPVV